MTIVLMNCAIETPEIVIKTHTRWAWTRQFGIIDTGCSSRPRRGTAQVPMWLEEMTRCSLLSQVSKAPKRKRQPKPPKSPPETSPMSFIDEITDDMDWQFDEAIDLMNE
jgi:hypothetical protein